MDRSKFVFRYCLFLPVLFMALIIPLKSVQSATPLTTELVASGLDRPVYICSAPGDSSRLFIVEQFNARILVLKGGTVQSTPFLDIDSLVSTDANERGLLGLVFHPDYQSNGFFYVNYTDLSGNTEVARFSVSANPDVADPDTRQTIITYAQPFSNHNAGMLAFGPGDGYLYIAAGDGGSGGDPGNRAQSGNILLGKILRIDVDGGTPYAIPPDNPFVDSASYLDEIWALGVRNPWRFTFDRATGDMYIADVGQNAWEEIDFQPASSGGENYGWRCYEGNHVYNSLDCGPSTDYIFPIHEYNHDNGNCSVTGGYVYRGCAVPDLDGTYFFADFCSGSIWSFRYDGSTMTDFTDRTAELYPPGSATIGTIASFGEDINGELYIVDLAGGEIFKIIPDGVPSACSFSCGDVDAGGSVNILDATYIINYLYKGGPAPNPPGSADVNGSGSTNILDVTYLINYLYKDGPALMCP